MTHLKIVLPRIAHSQPGESVRNCATLLRAALVFMLAATTPAGAQTYTELYNFQSTIGMFPIGVPAQGRDGNLYGTTVWGGGGGCSAPGCGILFKITPAGKLTVLDNFHGVDASGLKSGVTLGTDGNFYGTTYGGGSDNYGAVFKMTPGGTRTTLHNFTGVADNGNPGGPPIQGTDGNFYGTTGANNTGTLYRIISSSGAFATLASLPGPSTAPLIQGTDGSFYGTTEWGGNSNVCGNPVNFSCGTVFKITPEGIVTVVYNFDFTHGGTFCLDEPQAS